MQARCLMMSYEGLTYGKIYFVEQSAFIPSSYQVINDMCIMIHYPKNWFEPLKSPEFFPL